LLFEDNQDLRGFAACAAWRAAMKALALAPMLAAPTPQRCYRLTAISGNRLRFSAESQGPESAFEHKPLARFNKTALATA